MKFDVFEKMYELLWEAIYKILAIFGVELENPYKKDEA